MAVISTTTKVRFGLKLARRAARHPRALMLGVRMAMKAAGPMARVGLFMFRVSRRGHTAPRLAAGAALGAGAAYFLAPDSTGREHRRRALELVP